MVRRRRSEGVQSNTIIKMGLGQDVPSAEFGEQPDSGSRIGGVRGKQEYGIEGGVSDELETMEERGMTERSRLVEQAQAASPGFSEFSEEATPEQEEESSEEEAYRDHPSGYMSPEELANLIRFRLRQHKDIHTHKLRVLVKPSGLVTITGRVKSEAEKLRATELTSAMPGVEMVDNKLTISTST